MKPQRVAILGHKGQIGSYLLEHLTKKGIICDEYDLPEGDCSDPLIFNHNSLNGVDFVFFLAFDVGGSVYLQRYQDTFQFLDNNVSLMNNVFKVLEKTKTPFLFASSQMANMSYSTYGVLKNIGERYTKALNGLIVKFWNVYGIEHDMQKTHVITDFIKMAVTRKRIDMLTNGEEQRQFLYADDCCDALEIVMNNHKDIPRDKELHITTNEWTSVYDVAKIIAEGIGPDVIVNRCGMTDIIQFDKRNEADQYFLTNWWQPKTELREGIYDILAYELLQEGL